MQARYVNAIGDPSARQRTCDAADRAGLQAVPVVVHVSAKGDFERISIGEGTVVCAGCILTVDIVVGRHVHLNLGCTVGHDCRVGDFATFAPGVHLSGNVTVGRRAYVGSGAVVRQGISIGEDAVIGMGAVVTKDVPAGVTAMGVPARWAEISAVPA